MLISLDGLITNFILISEALQKKSRNGLSANT